MNQPYSPLTPQPPKKKSSKRTMWTLIGVFGGLFLLFILLISFATCALIISDDDPLSGFSHDYVGVLSINGAITSTPEAASLLSAGGTYSQSYVLEAIKVMKEDDDNKGILLLINSPGGEMYAVDEVYLALMDYKEKTGRPIYTYCEEYCASGGYYLAVASDVIYANPMSTVGSIGVTYGTHIDISGLCEKYGIKLTDIASDDNKSMGSYTAPLSADQMAIYQGMIDEYYDHFLNVVDAGRETLTKEDLTRKEVLDTVTNENGDVEEITLKLADGRVFTAKQAKEHGLIDKIGTLSGAMSEMRGVIESDELAFEYFTYIPDDYGYGAMISMSDSELLTLLLSYSEQAGPMVLYKD